MPSGATTGVPSGATAAAAPRGRTGAALVAAGILASRLAGLVRQRVFAHYFGQSEAADAFNAAFRIPNFLQNLFGEGVLSASFIPVYSKALASGDVEGARRVASVVGTVLALATSLLVLAGMLASPLLVDALAPGFEGERRELTMSLVRVLFPGTGLLVLSAWCLGILNSHRRFFLSYAAPVGWSAVMIAAMVAAGSTRDGAALATVLAWAAVAGSALQLLVQVPSVMRLAPGLRPSLDLRASGVGTVLSTFGPVFVGRGVVQISAWVDSMLASFLPGGAVTAMANAQVLYTLPVSLFGMSVSAAELPAMSGIVGGRDEVAAALRARLDAGLARVAFFIVPSATAFACAGDVLAAALFQTGRFGAADATWVWGILAGSSIGLLASTLGRLYASTFYALHDTRTPLRCAMVRVGLATVLGWLASIHLPGLVGVDARWGVAFLAAASGLAGWVEFALLRRALAARIGATGIGRDRMTALWGSAALAAAAASLARVLAPSLPPLPAAAVVLAPFGAAWLAATWTLRIPEARAIGRKAGLR